VIHSKPPSEDTILAAAERAVGRHPALKWRWWIDDFEEEGPRVLFVRGETPPDQFGEILSYERCLQTMTLKNATLDLDYLLRNFVDEMAKHLEKGL
jgi:hypothetical protein